MIRSPKDQFVNSPHRLPFEKIVDTEYFQAACDYALLILSDQLPDASDPAKGWDSWSQLSGAKRLLSILKTIHEPIKEHRESRLPSLNYNQK